MDEFGSAHRSELAIDKDLERVSAGEIGFSVEDGKAIMAHLQQVVVNQQCEAYVLTRVAVQTLEVEPIRGLEVALDHAASTAFQISGAVLCLTRSLSSLN